MKKHLCVFSLVTLLLTGCVSDVGDTAEKENVTSEIVSYTETSLSETVITTESTTVSEVTSMPDATISTQLTIDEAQTTAVTELPVTLEEIKHNKYISFIVYNDKEASGQYIIGSKDSLEFYTYFLGCDTLFEWGKNIDFEKNAVVMYVHSDLSSSYKFELNNVYVENNQIVFDYDSYCPGTANEDIVDHVIAGIVPKDDLEFLGNDDEWGVELEAYYDPDEHCVQLKFLQWGEKEIQELLSGSWYELERYDEEKGWCKVEYSDKYKNQEIGWTSEGWTITEYGQSTYTNNLFLYDKLQAGRYRIAKGVINIERAGDIDEKIYYAEFGVR